MRDLSAPSQRSRMNGVHIGRSLRRLEDDRFLTGQGRYVDDIDMPGQLHGIVLRSPYGHAAIDGIDTAGASGAMSFGEHTGLNAIKAGKIVVPTDADGAVWLHFTPHQPERFISASKILDGTADPELVKDNIVVIGTTAEGLKEFRATPLDPAEAGV